MPAGSIIGGFLGSEGALASGAAAGQAGARALSNSWDVANRDVARLTPWQASGAAAAQQVNALLGLGKLGPIGDAYNTYGTKDDNWQADQKNAFAKFQTDPGYQFRMQQGTNALDRSASARGMNLSGAQTKALDDYGQGQGSQEYDNYFKRLSGVSGMGETAAAGANSAYNDVMKGGINDQFLGDMGRASSYSSAANALASGINKSIDSLGSIAGYTGLGKNMFAGV